MGDAKKKDSGDEVFLIEKLNKLDNKNLCCKYCGADVQYISAHQKGETPISAYLKLWQKAEHSENCGYSVKGAVALLVAESKSVETTNNPIFELQNDESYLFRMNMLIDAQEVAKKIIESEHWLESDVHTSNRKNYIRSKKQLASYFHSAAGIAKLRALIQDASDIEELSRLIKIQYNDKLICWNDFYYDDTRYDVLFNKLTKGNISHPVAVGITLKGKVMFYEDAKIFPWSFQCFSQQIKDENNQKTVYIPKLQLAKEDFHESMSDGEAFLVVGNIWKNEVKKDLLTYRNLNISVLNKSQFIKELS